MIAYEELQRALARWKTRRSGAGEGADGVPQSVAPAEIVADPAYQAPDSTGELDLADAEVDEAQ